MVIDGESTINQGDRVYAQVEHQHEDKWPKRAKLYNGLTSEPLEILLEHYD